MPKKTEAQKTVTIDGQQTDIPAGPWSELKTALSAVELQALKLLCKGSLELKGFADEHGIMLEVLVDGINEKAMDVIGDGLIDEEFILYEDYIEEVRKLVEEWQSRYQQELQMC